MRKLPPLKALRAFEAAARHESIIKAAGELNVSHSAVSQQVKILEQYFGQKLFQRTGNGIALTTRAKSYLDDIRHSLDRIAIASENFASMGVISKIRINATPSFAMRWLIPRIADFQRNHPLIEVHIDTSETDEIDHLGAGYDLVIRRHEMAQVGMGCERILNDVSVAVMSPGLAEKSKLAEPADLLNFPLLHMKSRASAWSKWFEHASITTHETLKGQVHDHFFLSLEAAINGSGVALAPRSLVHSDIQEGRLLVAFPKITLTGPGFHCLYNSKDKSSRRIAPVLKWLLEEGSRAVSKD